MNWLITSNEPKARFIRTVIEAALGFIVANIAVVVAGFNLDPATATAVCAIATAIISPIVASLKDIDEQEQGGE